MTPYLTPLLWLVTITAMTWSAERARTGRSLVRTKKYRLPEEQVEAEFPADRREEARMLLEYVVTYTPPDEREALMFRLLNEAHGDIRRLRDGALREPAMLPDGTRVPLLQRGKRG